MDEFLKELEVYAEEKNIPIMQKKGIDFLCKIIAKSDVKNILEIGTAIGYSAIKMALVNDDITVTSIERDQDRYIEALKNIKKAKLDKRIDVIYKDALDVKLKDKYDLIFIDAAKGQYIKFFEKFKENLNPGGIIISDNTKLSGKNCKLFKSCYTLKIKVVIISWKHHIKSDYSFNFIRIFLSPHQGFKAGH